MKLLQIYTLLILAGAIAGNNSNIHVQAKRQQNHDKIENGEKIANGIITDNSNIQVQVKRLETEPHDQVKRHETKQHDQVKRQETKQHDQVKRHEIKQHDQVKRHETKPLDQVKRHETKQHDQVKRHGTKQHDQVKRHETKQHDQVKRHDTKQHDQVKRHESKQLDQVKRHETKLLNQVKRQLNGQTVEEMKNPFHRVSIRKHHDELQSHVNTEDKSKDKSPYPTLTPPLEDEPVPKWFDDPCLIERCPIGHHVGVCGSDGSTYTTLCELQSAKCINPGLELVHFGNCNPDDPIINRHHNNRFVMDMSQ